MEKSNINECCINSKLYENHIEYLVENFTKEQSECVNIGWGSAEDRIETKIYGNPCLVLTSTISGNDIKHLVEQYS